MPTGFTRSPLLKDVRENIVFNDDNFEDHNPESHHFGKIIIMVIKNITFSFKNIFIVAFVKVLS